MVHERIWDCEQFIQLKPTARLLFIGLVVGADDEGCFRADARYWKRKVFHSDRIGVPTIEKMFDEMHGCGLITIGETKKGLAGYHPNWHKYQTLRRDRSKPSDYSDILVANGLSPAFGYEAQEKLSEDNIKEENINQDSVSYPSETEKTSKSAREQILDSYNDTKNKMMNNSL